MLIKMRRSTILYLQLLLIIAFKNATQLLCQKSNGFLQDLDFNFRNAKNGSQLLSILDSLIGLNVMIKHYDLTEAKNDIDKLHRYSREHEKMQPIITLSTPFPCNLSNARSPTSPTLVHRLRPGDIDVIAAIGDSLSAGLGILASNPMQLRTEFRGYTFSGGGLGNWRDTLTLPNILKVFNPNLYGYSTDHGLTVDSTSHLNIAEPMLMSRDLPYQAKVLISRLRQDPHVDMQHHWKLLTIFVGVNDICSDICHHDNLDNVLATHEYDLQHTFTMLRDQVPRLIVNLLPTPNMVEFLNRGSGIPLQCRLLHAIECHCVFNFSYNSTYYKRILKYIRRWQKIEQRIATLPEFQTNDFAVVFHPFTKHLTKVKLKNGDADLRSFSVDCLHFSQLGHAGFANTLWNSMLQPVGQKQTLVTELFKHFECPSEKHPFLATIGNS